MSVIFSSYDEPLGPRSDRYFGEGYKKVGPELSHLRISRSAHAGAAHSGIARLSYPAAWSRKEHRELVPHVSSVDTVMLAAALCDIAVTRTRRLAPEQAARMWVRHGSVRAGARPHEDLEHIPVSATVTATCDTGDGESETAFKFQVGNLTGTLTIVHPTGTVGAPADGVELIDTVGEVHGHAPHYYLTGVKDHTLTASDLRVDAESGRITSTQQVSTGIEGGYVGAESAYWNSVSPIDLIVGAAQLSQILLYQLDSLDRTRSNTLWMRKLEFFVADPHDPATGAFDGTVEARRLSVIDRGGQQWRSADLLIKEFRGLTGSCLLAHQLPE